tara:strand:+ start:222 stop:740 length:519 start_codon:yes stop_codon:yes gene_type:complete
MKNFFVRLLESLLIKKGILIFSFSLLAISSAVIAVGNNNPRIDRQKNNIKPSFNNEKKIISPSSKVLIPMPKGDIDMASRKVENTRDPFQEPQIIETSNLEILNSVIKFKGIAKHGDNLVAMIKTSKEEQIYKVGDSIGNGFTIKEISASDITVDISDGLKNYRLALDTLRK